MNIPYAIFQGVYSTKRRRRVKTMPGFFLNRYALQQADMVFTNKRRDEINLRRLLPASRLRYIAPGIKPDPFKHPAAAPPPARWPQDIDGSPVILTAAMFRPGVKADGVAQVITSCGHLLEKGHRFRLVVCGDGIERDALQRLARSQLGRRVTFLGRVPREEMPACYQNADLFVFPGIQEGLGMVYLEAQAAGLPIVACDGWGASEVVRPGETGLLSPPGDWEHFENHVAYLLKNAKQRHCMGRAASRHVAAHHDVECNYHRLERHLEALVTASSRTASSGKPAPAPRRNAKRP
jgi:glycosyltransferase involved in cell wall biosynthesis